MVSVLDQDMSLSMVAVLDQAVIELIFASLGKNKKCIGSSSSSGRGSGSGCGIVMTAVVVVVVVVMVVVVVVALVRVMVG